MKETSRGPVVSADRELPTAPPRVLGQAGPPEINTGGSWLTSARTAYFTERDTQRARHRELTLVLGNMLGDMLGVGIAASALNGPSVVLDGHRFTVREYMPTQGEREFRLAVAVVCPFCERENEREFGTLEELGQILCEPTGNCGHCSKPLGAAGATGAHA